MTAAASVLDQARARLHRERDRLKRAAQPRPQAAAGDLWRPTPTPGEANIAAQTGNPVMVKVWDTSPIDASAFDGTEPPALPSAAREQGPAVGVAGGRP